MLKKLFLYDFTATGRRAFPLLIAILGAGAISLLVVLVGSFLPIDDTYGTVSNLLTAVLYLVILASLVLFFLATLQIYLHYFRSFFSNEGCFTFMIPASREQLFFSKVLSGFVWTLLILFAVICAFTLGILLPFEIVLRTENLSFLSVLFRDLWDNVSLFSAIDAVILTLSQIITVYTAITMGALFFRKRKLIGAVLFYLALSLGIFILRLAISLIFSDIIEESDIITSLLSVLVSLICAACGYLISRALLCNKLNLI